MSTPRIDQSGSDCLLWIKAVPGASRSQVAGVLGDRLKIRTSAVPQQGKANQAICELLARQLKVKTNQVTIESGHTNPKKIVRIARVSADQLRKLWE